MTDPVAPASDAALASAPDYIIDGDWDDADWRAVAARKSSLNTEAEVYLFVGGPRLHPWGAAAFTGPLPDGRLATFPNKAAYDKHMGTEAPAEDTAKGEGVLDALNAGLAAHAHAETGEVQPASDPDQADAMLEGAAPHGHVAG
ncbi:MAG: hypothetical protein NVS1B6_12700 [Steroidobacteraceae bacterium]